MSSLEPATVEPLLTGRLGRPYIYRETCESSQLLLREATSEGATAVCDEQTAGRGRLGRRWDAPRGTAILCSVLLQPPADRRAAELSLVGGLAAADAVEVALGRGAQIKWPNDVLVDGRKLAGILADARDGAVVLGIGINVNQAAAELLPSAASLRAIDGVIRDRAPLLAALLEGLERDYEAWLGGGLQALHARLSERDFLRGRRVSHEGTDAVAVGIDPAGRLELEVDGERRFVESGEITL